MRKNTVTVELGPRLVAKNFFCHKETSLELKPLTLLVGPPGTGKTLILRGVYMLTWLLAGRSRESLVPLLLPWRSRQERDIECELYVGDARLAIRGGEVVAEGKAPWKKAILLPHGYPLLVRGLYELASFSRETIDRGADVLVSELSSILYLISKRFSSIGIFSATNRLTLLAADLLAQINDAEQITDPSSALTRILHSRTSTLLRQFLDLPEADNPQKISDIALYTHIVEKLIENVESDTLVAILDMTHPVNYHSIGVKIYERNRRGDNIYLLAAVTSENNKYSRYKAECIIEQLKNLSGILSMYITSRLGDTCRAERVDYKVAGECPFKAL